MNLFYLYFYQEKNSCCEEYTNKQILKLYVHNGLSRQIKYLADELTARGGLMWCGGPEPDQDTIWSMAHPAG